MAASKKGSLIIRFTGDTKRLKKASGAAVKLIAGTAIAAGAVAVKLTKDAAELDAKQREVVSLFGETGRAAQKSLGQVSKITRSVSDEFGIAQKTLTEGLYSAISAGVPKKNALEFMRVASKAAIAGVTDVETAVDGITTTINAFGLKAKDAEKVSDSMFTAVKGGKTTFQELSDALFNVAPAAAAAGVKFTEVNAAIATLTAGGTPTSVATTQLRAAMDGLQKPSKALNEIFGKLGFKNAQAAIESKGLGFALDAVKKASKGNNGELQKLLGSSEAVAAANVLAGTGAKKFSDELKAQKDSAGATDKAFQTMNEGAARQFEILKTKLENAGLAIGQMLLPHAVKLAGWINDKAIPAVKKFGGWIQDKVVPVVKDLAAQFMDRVVPALKDFGGWVSDKIVPVLGDLWEIASAVGTAVADAFEKVALPALKKLGGFLLDAGKIAAATLGGMIKFVADNKDAFIALGVAVGAFFAVMKTITIIQAAVGVFKALKTILAAATIEQIKLNIAAYANPYVLLAVAIAALVAGLVYFFTQTKTGKKIWKAFTGFLSSAMDGVVKFFKKAWSWIQDAISNVWGWIKKNWPLLLTIIAGPIGFAVSLVIKHWDKIKRVTGKVWNAIKGAIGKAWDWIKKYVFGPIKWYVGVIVKVFKFYGRVARAVWNGVKDAIGKAWGWIKGKVFQPIARWVKLLRIAFGILRERISDVWGKIKRAIGKVWNWIKDNVFSKIRRWIRILRIAFGILKDRVSEVWGRIKSRIRAVWDWIKDKVFNPLRKFIRDTVPDAFKNGVAKITSFWDKIRKAASKPVKFVADTVYNKGIRKVINYVIDLVGGDKLPKWQPYAQGGYTGPGSKMQPAGVVHADEFVMSKSARRGLEATAPGALDFMNKTGRWPGYAGGGLVDAAKWWTARGARASEHPAFGGVRGGHMKGSLHYTGNAVDLNYGPGGQNSTEMSFFDRLIGVFKSKFPNLGVLWRTAGHFNHMHIDTGGRSAGGGGGGGILAFLEKLRDLKGGLAAGVGGSGFGKLMGRAGNWMVKGPINWLKKQGGPLMETAGDFVSSAVKEGTKGIVRGVAATHGGLRNNWGLGSQWKAIDWLVNKESSWNPNAKNPTSSARGLFQKMTSIHGPIESTVSGQAKWGLNYIQGRYGNPLNAMRHHMANNWYAGGGLVKVPKFDNGGTLGRGLNLVNNATGAPEQLHRTPPRDDRPIHIHLEIGGRDIGTIIVDTVRREVRKNGGNVQATLGRGR